MTSKLNEFEGYQKSFALFDFMVEYFNKRTSLMRLWSQPLTTVTLIYAKVAEGSGRWSSAGFLQNYVIARELAIEAAGRYKLVGRWLAKEVIVQRLTRCNEIITIFTATISSMKRQSQ